MIKLFPKTYAECIKCNTPMLSETVKFIGGYAYCAEHYEKEIEKVENEKKQSEMNWFNKYFK